jgi:capsular exopolysaccharide synthesis family protein
MPDAPIIQRKLPNQEIDYFKIGKILISRWHWIVLSVVACLGFSYLYLWYTPKSYATLGSLKLEEKKSEIADLVNVLSNSERGPSKIQSETFVIQSHAVLLNAIKDLDYRISFYIGGRIRTTDLYPYKSLNIQLITFDSLNLYHGVITYQPVNKHSCKLSYQINGKTVTKNYGYDQPITIASTSFSIKSPGDIAKNIVYLFKFNNAEDFLGRVRGGLHINELVKNSNVLSLQETDSNPQFAADILNAIMVEYLTYDRNQRTQSATSVINFIDKQLDYLLQQVKGSEKSIENFKQNTKILDVNASSVTELSKASGFDAQKSLLKFQLIAIDQLKQEVIEEKNNTNISLNIEGSISPQLSAMITRLDNLLIEKSNMIKTYNADSPPVQDINKQILVLKNAALISINNSRALVEKNMKYLDAQLAQVNSQITKLPAAEGDLAGLKRNFEINDKVYSFLSEKKLNAQISRSAIIPGATIIEQAQPNFSPVFPNDREIHRSAMIIGVMIGLGFIILIRIINPYIYDKETIESLTSVPIIGIIRKFPASVSGDNDQILSLIKPKSIFAESVRSVRTNLSFLASEKQSKIICVTSEVAGEGKSFVALNLSSTLSLIDKKVLLIAADLRRSKLHNVFHVANDVGLSNYLANQCQVEDIIHVTDQPNLDFIVSGPVPPNPSELLHSERMKNLINELKLSYDIIMIDTAPIGLVSDAIPLIRLSDVNVFVIRSGKSKFYAATVPQRIAQEYHLDNTVIVLNAFEEDLLHARYYNTKFTGENYGTRYYYYSDYNGYEGAGYYVEDKKYSWWDWRRWFKR